MSGTNLIDDYLADLMDDPPPRKPDKPGEPATPAEAPPPDDAPPAEEPPDDTPPAEEPPADEPPVEEPPAEDAPAQTQPEDAPPLEQDPDAPPSPGEGPTGDGPLETDPDQPAAQASAEAADPLAAFRDGGKHITDDEFEAMLDVLQGTAPPPAAAAPAPEPAAPPVAGADPLAAFRTGDALIGDDEFEAMLDALQGAPPAASAPSAPAAPSTPAAAPAPAPAPPAPPPEPVRAAPPVALDHMLAPQAPIASALIQEAPHAPERRRRAEERISAWLRFNLGDQCFGVEVLKVQEVLKVPSILPVRGTDSAMLGLMNLRGQIVPVMDLAIRLGFGPVETNEASRVIVLEENGETLGALVAAVADVANVSDSKIERISGTSSLVAADVVRGIARREGTLIILLDATRLLA